MKRMLGGIGLLVGGLLAGSVWGQSPPDVSVTACRGLLSPDGTRITIAETVPDETALYLVKVSQSVVMGTVGQLRTDWKVTP